MNLVEGPATYECESGSGPVDMTTGEIYENAYGVNVDLLRAQLMTAIDFFETRADIYARAHKYDEADWDETTSGAYESVLAALDAEEHSATIINPQDLAASTPRIESQIIQEMAR